MKKNKKIITICASASHYRQALEIKKQLMKIGYKVLIPSTARVMEKNNNFDVNFYKTWYKNNADYKKKTKLMVDHFKKVLKGDGILVVNCKKNGLEGYIGGNVLMEMVIAFHYKKPVFVYNNISEKLSIKEEIYGLNSIFINGDLNLIKI